MNQRGPDYADELSTSEQATLDRLLEQVAHRRRRGLGAPLAAGLAAALVLLAVASAMTVARTTQRPVEAASATSGPAAVLDQLAVTADAVTGRSPTDPNVDPAPRTPGPTRDVSAPDLRLEVAITKDGSACAVSAIAVSTRLALPADWTGVLFGQATLSLVSPPAAATTLAGCENSSPFPPKGPYQVADTIRYGKDLARAWPATIEHTPAALLLPPYVDPRMLADVADIENIPPTTERILGLLNGLSAPADDPAARWWALWTDLMTSPCATPAQRAAALRAAAAKVAEVSGQVRTIDAADVTGRSGIAIQVPYLRGEDAVVAWLTFDQGTGALSQRTVVYPVRTLTRFEITAYTIFDSSPDMAWVRQLAGA